MTVLTYKQLIVQQTFICSFDEVHRSINSKSWKDAEAIYVQGVSKRIHVHQNHHEVCQKQKALPNSGLDTCVVHTFKVYFMFYKCSMWPPPAARTTLNRYDNSSQTRFSFSRFTVLNAAIIRSSCYRHLLEVVKHKRCLQHTSTRKSHTQRCPGIWQTKRRKRRLYRLTYQSIAKALFHQSIAEALYHSEKLEHQDAYGALLHLVQK